MSNSQNSRQPSHRFSRLSGPVLIAIALLFGGWFVFSLAPMTDQRHWPARFETNGERIYFTGTSSSGQDITPRGGGMHMQMMTGACVVCHGTDRKGGRLMHRFWQAVPPVTSAALFGEHVEGQDAHGDHDAYTTETLGRAITEGIGPDAKPLDLAMPRWAMSPDDLADLIFYLKGPEAKAH